jgi:hypothetical protein
MAGPVQLGPPSLPLIGGPPNWLEVPIRGPNVPT